MASESEPNPLEEEQQQRYQQDQEAALEAPAHHPSAPPDELFDISTTVDPSYIISLIRKLIPTGLVNDHNTHGVDASDATGDGLSADCMEDCGAFSSRDQVQDSFNESESMSTVDSLDKSACQDGDKKDSSFRCEQPCVPTGEEAWEEYGCVLWDLAASKTHAELMVENLILEVLLAHLMFSQSVRITEICLGIIGNLACHEVPMKHIISTNGLIEIIVDQLFLDDTQCLCEACRLLTSGLQSDKCNTWAEALQPEHILGRIVWVAENTLNPQLLEKSVGLLLAILESQQDVSSVHLLSLMKLGLTSLLINLFASEMSMLKGERVPERYAVLDVILRAIEALSNLDGNSLEICFNKELFQLVCDLFKLPDKVEIASSCATASVLIANILSDVPDLALEISHDLTFLQGLLDIFPLVSDDLEARSALWSIIARLLVCVKENDMGLSNLHQYVLALVSKTDLIEDDLLDQKLDNPSEESKSLTSSNIKSYTRRTALRRIVSILNQWTASKDSREGDDVMEENYAIDLLLIAKLHSVLILESAFLSMQNIIKRTAFCGLPGEMAKLGR
ncbi:hypothetical protein GH714_015334 [Hevea brasiliensis]|uniref:Wings apart-like protein C-terminal domain-containing protein n=1 Tax=Hevea brasiliensis TaxID=3981 RepID=A0A6A6LKT3_HEVBR|nr:hypothetical protein GH714_015334 [Hevea brasiliensis]